jgi:hypothetical protein
MKKEHRTWIIVDVKSGKFRVLSPKISLNNLKSKLKHSYIKMPRHKLQSKANLEATDQNITLTNIKQHEEAIKQLERDCKKRAELKQRDKR